jgi:hypothetical protein
MRFFRLLDVCDVLDADPKSFTQKLKALPDQVRREVAVVAEKAIEAKKEAGTNAC